MNLEREAVFELLEPLSHPYGALPTHLYHIPLLFAHLVLMFGNHHAGQRAGEVTLQVREHNRTVVAGGQQVVGARREPHAPHLTTVHLQ